MSNANANEEIFEACGGCAAKMEIGALSEVLRDLPRGGEDKNLLVGFESSDDAAVYKLTEELAIVNTLDFFPPIVSDPYLFGQIAATNALSDVYAMGGEVKLALNIVCFPDKMDREALHQILRGGSDKVLEAGGILCGGHTIIDRRVKYGLSVTGLVHPKKVLANNTCRAGDKLILTKPLGVGIIMAAYNAGQCGQEAFEQAVKSMTTLNKYSAEKMKNYEVHACTDVTGFGFLGHLSEMTNGSFTAVIDKRAVPIINEAYLCAEEFLLTAAAERNRRHVAGKLYSGDVKQAFMELLFDPQTSGGLLISMAPGDAEPFVNDVRALGGFTPAIVGEIVEKRDYELIVT